MVYPRFDRSKIKFHPLEERRNKVHIERDCIEPSCRPRPFSGGGERVLEETVARLRRAREEGKPRMIAFGAHTIKNGLAPVFIELLESGWVTHLATNGAGIIHDWEFAYQGCSSEDVRENVAQGRFGIWEETGFYLNLAIVVGAFNGLGYGESVGRFVEDEGLDIPSRDYLSELAEGSVRSGPVTAAAACDLAQVVDEFELEPGWMAVEHPYKRYGLQAAAYRLGIPFTSHPMIGHDIIYTHPMNHCAAIGRAAQRDFLTYAHSVSRLDGGVYMSIGSAVMSPMIFEKSLSMSQNIAIQEGERIDNHFVVVVDLQESHWDWTTGEPPEDNPDYYLRYCKSFARMGGAMRYLAADNRDFLLAITQRLTGIEPGQAWKPRGKGG